MPTPDDVTEYHFYDDEFFVRIYSAEGDRDIQFKKDEYFNYKRAILNRQPVDTDHIYVNGGRIQ